MCNRLSYEFVPTNAAKVDEQPWKPSHRVPKIRLMSSPGAGLAAEYPDHAFLTTFGGSSRNCMSLWHHTGWNWVISGTAAQEFSERDELRYMQKRRQSLPASTGAEVSIAPGKQIAWLHQKRNCRHRRPI